MKKTIKIIVGICLLFVSCFTNLSYKVQAESDFEINERSYIEKCNSSTMSKSDVEICSEFNAYLKDKNKQLQTEMDGIKTDISNTEVEISSLQDEISRIEGQIDSKEVEINYFIENINATTARVLSIEKTLKDRMYSMQVYVNSNQLISFILGATSFSELFSRIDGVNQITSHDKELVRELSQVKKESEEQKVMMEESKTLLTSMVDQKAVVQDQLNIKLEEMTAVLGYIETEYQMTAPVIQQLESAVESSKVSIAEQEAYLEWLEQQKPPVDNGGSEEDSGGTEDEGSTPGGDTSDIAFGALQLALSKKGSPYVWGGKSQLITKSYIDGLKAAYPYAHAAGDYDGLEAYYDTGTLAFDCSGLTMWAYNRYGIFVGWSTYSQQETGYPVSWENMVIGDLILFDWDNNGATDHVGMYAGNGMMVHTSTPKDGLGVHLIDLNASSTWRNHCYTIRRIV